MDERRLLSAVLERRVRLSNSEQRRHWAKLWIMRFDVNAWRPALFEWGAHPTGPLLELDDEALEQALDNVPERFAVAAAALKRAIAHAAAVDDGPHELFLVIEWIQKSALALEREHDDLKARVDDTGGISDA